MAPLISSGETGWEASCSGFIFIFNEHVLVWEETNHFVPVRYYLSFTGAILEIEALMLPDGASVRFSGKWKCTIFYILL